MNNNYKSVPVNSSEITPYSQYLSRREFLKAAGLLGGSALLAACAPGVAATVLPGEEASESPVEVKFDELGDPSTAYEDITHYNNYYEFSAGKEAVASLSKDFNTNPWTVEVYGLVKQPKTYGIEDLLGKFTQEERIYRLRCVEAWSMVIPWTGFTLSSILNEVEPTSDAQFVRFETVYRPEEMQGQGNSLFTWPYQEGLRLDEAMNNLTILATGLYGEPLPNQNGAPIRLVVPWKYGFKSIKAITKIELVAETPSTLWHTASSREYGFYSNVNPERPHPRWSQASERRIGELNRRPTLMFNGYAEQVAGMYAGMDLIENY
ncbi:MAG TPA: protein-methionine-sulfoxide reductase catalytic subunit MsrP [Anaerolineales bacterium]|jgi:sulfoxide reductase catalytic subunit YedY|nr:protein-methionine-sulfoxide reductase catalytic subunit MsrP [Anaerolineales bacterium]HQX17464.1 protein-methionine-sulfoxide reductase catalytic subunit MsrP [Anaerolineales bacterium]